MTNQTSSSEGTLLFFEQTKEKSLNEERLLQIVVNIVMSVLFTCINSVLFYTLRSKPVFRELPRYLLFAHMLCNDTVQLVLSQVFFLLVLFWQRIPKTVCSFLIFLAATTINISPLNVGLMSLERYVAICFPLHHSQMATRKMTGISILVIWFLASINAVIDILYALIVSPLSFGGNMFCAREMFIFSKWQVDLFQGFSGFFFVAITAIILFTYVSVILAARSASADKESANKAWKTVLLHFGQMILCLNNLIYGTIERALLMVNSRQLFINLRVVNFLVVLILPRCLSPLIYGLRDDTVRPLFLYYVRCGTQKIKPTVTAH